MILLDENIPEDLREALVRWKPFQIGVDHWSKGTQDHEIATRLRHERNVTFFTRDRDFYEHRHEYGHYNCAIIFVDTGIDRFAVTVDRFLRHHLFRTHASRMGLVLKLTERTISGWRVLGRRRIEIVW